MKLHNIALIGLLLGSSVAFAGPDKETLSTKNPDTAKFIRYSAFALINGSLSLFDFYDLWNDIISKPLIGKLLACYLSLGPAFLAQKDAKNAWAYLHRDSKTELSSSLAEETKVSSPKKIYAAKLIGHFGLFTLSIALATLGFWATYDGIKANPLDKDSISGLLNAQAQARLAVLNFQSMREQYNKVFSSNNTTGDF
jgi:hypothetical protein